MSFTDDNPIGVSPPGSDDPGAPRSGGINLARGGHVDWLSRPTSPSASPAPGNLRQTTFLPAGGSDDLSTAYFTSDGTLTPADDLSGRVPGDAPTLYKWQNGTLANAGILPDGSTDPGGSFSAGYGDPGAGNTMSYTAGPRTAAAHAVSSDGRSTLFVSPAVPQPGQPRQLYLTNEGQRTVQLSTGPRGVVPAGHGLTSETGQVWAFASADRHYVVFSSFDALTPSAEQDAGAADEQKTYRFDATDRSLEYLPDLTVPSNDPNVYGVSDDGSRILYESRAGSVRLWADGIGVVPGSLGDADFSAGVNSVHGYRFTQDGSTLVLMSEVALGGEAKHPSGTTQIYRVGTTSGAARCISCGSQVESPPGGAKFSNWLGSEGGQPGPGASTATAGNAMIDSRGVTDDGRSVFFDTPLRLSDDDKNDVADVYEWRDDVVRLISQGLPGSLPTFFVDNDATGANVFFATADNIGDDQDDQYDMYDARVGGGFPEQGSTPPCSGDACQGPPQPGPSLLDPASPVVGPPSLGRHERPKAPKPELRVRRTRVSTTQITLGVTAPGVGRITVTGAGLKRVRRSVKRAATYTVKAGLTVDARRSLMRSGRLAIRARVAFAPKSGKTVSKTVTMTIKRAEGVR